MFRTSRQIVRIALVMMLFQFLAPSFMPLTAHQTFNEKVNAYNVQHNSIVAPTLLKEQDEKEGTDFTPASNPTQLLDLASHSFNLEASHKKKYCKFTEDEHGFLEPPLSILFCTLLI
ncbi:MAG: hypothetical protein OEV74_17735 [Cyclobacteriaceae bacterium]|nr:hypothetical protein [Cyclobacteriaceae bacterium]